MDRKTIDLTKRIHAKEATLNATSCNNCNGKTTKVSSINILNLKLDQMLTKLDDPSKVIDAKSKFSMCL